MSVRIAIASDAHDAMDNLGWFLDEAARRGAERVLFLGDLVSPPLARLLFARFPTHMVVGNNDGDIAALQAIAREHNGQVVPRSFAELEVEGQRVFLTHYPELAEIAADSSRFDLVCYGHDHRALIEDRGGVRVVNPGELWGQLTGMVSFLIWDPATGETELVRRDDGSGT